MSGMEIVAAHTHRVLAYVSALNQHGQRPHRAVVDEFAKDPDRRYRSGGGIADLLTAASSLSSMLDKKRVPDETYCQYLARLGWINDDTVERVELTAVGRALLKSLNAPVMEENVADVFEVVLSPDNPFAYAQALGGLSSVKESLLVEPYFRLQQLIDIAEFDNIVRVMVGSKLKPHDYELLAFGLASLPAGRSIELRKATDLHDRYLIPAKDGHAVMLGASLGGLGKKVSTMTTLGSVATIALRDAHERLWHSADVVEPKKHSALPPAPDPLAEVPTKATPDENTEDR